MGWDGGVGVLFLGWVRVFVGMGEILRAARAQATFLSLLLLIFPPLPSLLSFMYVRRREASCTYCACRMQERRAQDMQGKGPVAKGRGKKRKKDAE